MKIKIRKQGLKIGLLFLAVLALGVGIALPAYAATTSAPNGFHILQGTVQSVTAPGVTPPSFVVSTPNQGQVTVTTDNGTQYYIIPMGKAQADVASTITKDNKQAQTASKPRPSTAQDLKNAHIPANWRDNLGWLATFDNPASFGDIAAEDRVIVRAESTNLAKQVLIIKAPVNRTVRGNIDPAQTDATHIAIAPTGGGSDVKLNVVSTTRITLTGQTTISGYAVALYNSANDNALVVNIQANAPTPKPLTTNSN